MRLDRAQLGMSSSAGKKNSDEHQIDASCIGIPGLRPLALSAQGLSESVSAHEEKGEGLGIPTWGNCWEEQIRIIYITLNENNTQKRALNKYRTYFQKMESTDHSIIYSAWYVVCA